MLTGLNIISGLDGYRITLDDQPVDNPASYVGRDLYLSRDEALSAMRAAREVLPQLAATLAKPSQTQA